MTVSAIMAGAALATAGSKGQAVLQQNIGQMGGTGLQSTIQAIHRQWAGGQGKTYVSAAKDLIVEPLVLLDERLSHTPYIKEVLEGAQRFFTSYYLMTVAMNATLGGCTIQRRIGQFSPDRDLIGASSQLLAPALSTEAYQFGLPFHGELNGFARYDLYSTESAQPHYSTEATVQDPMKSATEIYNLSIGQIVNVEITDEQNKNRASIPVMIRLRVLGATPTNLNNILSLGLEDNSRETTKLKVKVKALKLSDAITNQHQIDAYRKARFADTTGYFRKAHNRANKGWLSTLLTGEPSIGSVSSIAIIDSQTRRELERQHYTNFEDYARRQSMFDKSMLIFMMVIDDAGETITVYTRDIEESQTYTLADIRKSAKGNNNDLTELIKTFLNGQMPGRL